MMASLNRGIGLYEFLIEAELQQYYNSLKTELKVTAVHQLKYVEDDDLAGLGFSKPEIRRLKKFFHKHCPPNYLSKFKNIIKQKKEDQVSFPTAYPDSETGSSHQVRVPSKHIIPAEAIVVNKELGVGEFGVVQQGVWTNEDGERIQVAIKCLSNDRLQTNPMEFLKEAAIMHTIDQEHIVRLYGVVLDTNALMLVTELAPLRSLLECLKEVALKSSFTVPVLCDFAIQICDGMHYLESKRLIHRDLAARNILVFSKNKVKISDFGLSRALGVGKDYYQTNFNVNLKLPIAWCAPECINFLRFTSASDIWAFGVTLWEMFSYGFQPWAALTGQQILEAIDEPNYQRLEQPECCPKEHYSIMLKCWQHDPTKRPKFSDLLSMLPDSKPEQVQAVTDYQDDLGRTRRDQLIYRTGDVITVLDKRPLADVHNCWKGVLNSGKAGLFNPAYTVTYIGTNLPSTKSSSFSRGDGKNAYSSKRRLRPEMISCPQGDFKHTGHVGLDGAYFGDISFLADKYNQLPKQVVAPYKPQDDDPSLSPVPSLKTATLPRDKDGKTQPSTKLSEKAPLLSKPVEGGKIGPAADHNWSDSASEPSSSAPPTPGFLAPATASLLPKRTKEKPTVAPKSLPSVKLMAQNPAHEYHEISDEEPPTESPLFESHFDLGPSLMDEIFSSLGSAPAPAANGNRSTQPISIPTSVPSNWDQTEASSSAGQHKASSVLSSLKDTLKKKHATVKPISASDEKALDQAIAMANELASKSMLELDKTSIYSSNMLDSMFSSSEDHVSRDTDSPHSPISPGRRKFSFKFGGKTSPRSERRHFAQEAASIPDIQACLSEDAKDAYNLLIEKPLENAAPSYPFTTPLTPSDAEEDSNPLRMLRAGVMLKPRVRGNKHQATVERSSSLRTKKVGPPVNPKPRSLNRPSPLVIKDSNLYREPERAAGEKIWLRTDDASNELPLPPRDRNKPIAVGLPRHQRKYPLVLPPGMTEEDLMSPTDLYAFSPALSTDQSQEDAYRKGWLQGGVGNPVNPLAKPPRVQPPVLDDSYDGQIASELEALEMIDETDSLSPLGVCPGPIIQKRSDHVSCEDLLEFACDRPNAKRTQGPARGVEADEVRIMHKVLGKDKLSAAECVAILDSTDWNVHNAIKLAKCRSSFTSEIRPPDEVLTQALSLNNWDVERALSNLQGLNTEV